MRASRGPGRPFYTCAIADSGGAHDRHTVAHGVTNNGNLGKEVAWVRIFRAGSIAAERSGLSAHAAARHLLPAMDPSQLACGTVAACDVWLA